MVIQASLELIVLLAHQLGICSQYPRYEHVSKKVPADNSTESVEQVGSKKVPVIRRN